MPKKPVKKMSKKPTKKVVNKKQNGVLIVGYSAENVLRLEMVEVTPEGSLVIIGGDNDVGKTSLIKSISMALGGARYVPKDVLREGAEIGFVKLFLDNDLEVTRYFTADRTWVEVKGGNGVVAKSPQKLLDTFLNKFGFNVHMFGRLSEEKRLEVLMRIGGLDFSEMNAERKILYAKRTGVNAQRKALATQLEGMVWHKDVGTEKKTVIALVKELDRIHDHNSTVDRETEQTERLKDSVNQVSHFVVAMKEDLEKLEAKENEARQKLAAFLNDTKHEEKIDDSSLRAELATVDETNSLVDENIKHTEVKDRLAVLDAEKEELAYQMSEIDRKKHLDLEAAELPIEGLSFGEDVVLFKGRALERASRSDRWRVYTAMAFAMANEECGDTPQLMIALVEGGSDLDSTSLKAMTKEVEKWGGQVWMERVSQGKECTVILEDGKVKGA